MNTINKFFTLAFVALALVATQSCKKTEFYNNNLVGTWNMTSMQEDRTRTTVYPNDLTIEGDLLERVEVSSTTFNGNSNKTGTETTTLTYDGLGLGTRSSVEEESIQSDFTYTTNTYVQTDGTTTSSIDTAEKSSSQSIMITFNKDKTFALTMDYASLRTSRMDNAAYSSVDLDDEEESNNFTGTWAYIGADKNQDFKARERIGLWLTSQTYEEKSTSTLTHVDKDDTDGFDYTDNNTNNVEISNRSDEGRSTEPFMIWEMIEGTGDEMQVQFVSSSTGNYKRTVANTSAGVTVTNVDDEYTRTSESSYKISFSK